jgi:hypothetical protein
MDEPVCPGCRELIQRVAELEAQVAALTRKIDGARGTVGVNDVCGPSQT